MSQKRAIGYRRVSTTEQGDPITVHFAEHAQPPDWMPEPNCRLCAVLIDRLLEAVANPDKWLNEHGDQ